MNAFKRTSLIRTAAGRRLKCDLCGQDIKCGEEMFRVFYRNPRAKSGDTYCQQRVYHTSHGGLIPDMVAHRGRKIGITKMLTGSVGCGK